jgi:hypothetical protein
MMLLLGSYTALWRRVFRRELLWRYGDFRRERNFPESKLSGVCSGGIRKYAEHLRKLFFFALAVFYSHRAPCGCSALREILLLEEIQD